jgi:REP element-mobilizing transposase RayT
VRGWYSRGYLPHFDEPDRIQFITYRLADSMPQSVLEAADEALRRGEITEAGRRKRIEYYLDQGHGACWLKDPAIAGMVEENLRHFDAERYRLLAWCVMPNHVHAMAEMMVGFPLEDVVHSWKSYTAHEINRILGRRGRVWQPEGFDRYIRDEKHFNRVIGYIEDNPVNAGRVRSAEDWPWCSARFRGEWL